MTREEALKIVRENYPHFGTTEPWLDLEKALATLIPELAESEDERIRKAIIHYILYETKGTISEATEHTWVKWLEKQKEQKPADLSEMMVHKEPYIAPVPTPMVADEQKPAEWSEEDEDMLNSCISSIEEAKENRYAYRETDGDTSYDHEISWLKSLRPSWKPSEEQMEALLNTLHPDDPYYHDLKSLYEQLKKL